MSKSLARFALAGALLAPGLGYAQDWKFSGQAGVGASYFNFEEELDGARLNEESGTVPVLNLQGFVETPVGIGLGLYYTRASDTLDYEGLSQQGVQISTDSDLEWSDLALAVAYQLRGNWLAAGWGRDNWERNIAATSGGSGSGEILGLTEERTIDYLFFGIARSLHVENGFAMAIKAQVDWGYGIDFVAPAPAGFQGPAVTNGGSAAGARISFPMSWNVWNGINLGATPFVQYWWVEDRAGSQILETIPPSEVTATADRPEATMLAVGINFSLSLGNF